MENKLMINVPRECLPLLREHRTHYAGDFVASYAEDLNKTFNSFRAMLPQADKPETIKILDIGCGMGGIDVLLSAHYQNAAKIILLDKNGCSEKINAGFHARAEDFAHYHDFAAAISLLELNNVPRETLKTVDITTEKFPQSKFNIVISLLSWGFHYPIDTYTPKVAKGGVIIADIRHETDGQKKLAEYGELHVVHEAKKFRRVVVQC